MLIFWAVLGGFLLDAVFGDPVWLLHPVVLMGRCITALEKRLRAALPKTPQGELAGGCIVAAVLPLGTLAVTGLSCWGAAKIHPLLGLALQMFWCAQALAARDLVRESMNVYRELQRGDLPAARKAVARIVGRDTQNLTAEGVTKAAVETVAENASDGVIAPLLYMLIGGAPLALTYKAINTMDSMLGYKNERYLYFGRCAACGAVLVVDECFLDFLPDRDALTAKRFLHDASNLIILKAFTKLYAMAGVRLGYALCRNAALMDKMRAAGQPWAVSSLAQAAGMAALGETAYADRVRDLIAEERPKLAAGLRALGLYVVGGRANYLLFQAPADFGETLRRRGAVVRSCANYPGLDGSWYRAAVRTNAENQKLLQIMGEVLA